MLLLQLSSCLTWMCMADVTADFFGVERPLVRAVIMTESSGRVNVVSKTGDYGIMQVNKRNIKDYRVYVDVKFQIIAGVEHLAKLRAKKHKLKNWSCRYNVGTAPLIGNRLKACTKYVNKLKYFGYVAKN